MDSVRQSVESGPEHSYLVSSVTDGVLGWDVDFSDRPPMAPQSDPTPLHLPFPLSDFQPSLITADDDVDLDVVRAAVLDTARSLHPGAGGAGRGSGFPAGPTSMWGDDEFGRLRIFHRRAE